MNPSAIVVIGPSGNGKSTFALALARRLGWRFVEGDDHHPDANITKLAKGEPLSEADRQPFLTSIAQTMRECEEGVVVACSALRCSHREHLRRARPNCVFVYPRVSAEELRRRVRERKQHFMSPALLEDQVAIFEIPGADESAITVDGSLPIDEQVGQVVSALRSGGKDRP